MSYADNSIRRLEDEWLGRRGSVEALLGVLADPGLETPLAVGVYGAWGSGKTSVMNLLRAGLPDGHLSLWFDAWKYARQDMALWRALLLAVVEALGDEQRGLPALIRRSPVPAEEIRARVATDDPAANAESIRNERIEALRETLDRLATRLYRSQTITEPGRFRVNWGAAVPLAVDLGLGALTAGLWGKVSEATGLGDKVKALAGFFADQETKEAMALIEREQATRHLEQVTSLEQFQRELRALVEAEVVGRGARLHLFVDDLDRCLPEDAIGALEALKLFLDLPGCVFVLGMDRRVVEQGIRVRYQAFELAGGPAGPAGPASPVDPRQYLDKIVQIPFRLPPLDDARMAGFVATWCETQYKKGEAPPADLATVAACAELIATEVAANPRSVKRTVSVLRLMLKLRGEGADIDSEADVGRLAKLVVLQTSYDDLYTEVIKRPQVLRELEAEARERHHAGTTMIPDMFAGEGGERLKAMLALPPHFEGLNEGELRELVYATEMAG